jgi:hypothetical protein
MIYVIITASIFNRFGLINDEKRKQRYLTAIRDTLLEIPSIMIPIIVENNGERKTYLEGFEHFGKPVQVVYTNNNELRCQNKSTIEMTDIKDVIRICKFQAADMIIKITGRYRMISPNFFMEVYHHEKKFDCFVKFYNVCTRKEDDEDCVLGCFAMRTIYLHLYPHLLMDAQPSAEKAFAKYAHRCGKIKKISQLDMECEFADSNEQLIV